MNTKHVFLAVPAFLLLISPVAAFAAPSYDGGQGFGRRMNDEYRRGGNSQEQAAIAQLSPTPVANLTVPVLFGVALRNLSRNFGDPRSGHTHEGLDIMAAEGLPIVTPTDGVVTHIGFDAGAGNFVRVAAPGSESLVYMHLNRVAMNLTEGKVLKAGDLVGYVGHTGNAIATAPHLHFELHDQTGLAVDPFPRITAELPVAQKLQYLNVIINNDPAGRDALSDLIVAKAKTELLAAKAQGIVLHEAVAAALLRAGVTAPAVVTTAPNTGTTTVVSGTSTGTLKLGSRGPEVAVLQQYLIKKNIGTAAKVTADGAFGPITKQAVIDFQKSAGLVADGVYGPKSKAYAVLHP